MPELQKLSFKLGGLTRPAGGGLADTIIALLSQQRDLYQQLSALARQQSEYVATGQSEHLMTVLAARNRLIDQISPLDKQLQPYKGRWQEVLNSFSPDQRSNAAMLLTQVQQMLADILERDEADKQSLVRQKTTVATELSQAVRGTQLNRVYGMRPNGGGRGGITG